MSRESSNRRKRSASAMRGHEYAVRVALVQRVGGMRHSSARRLGAECTLCAALVKGGVSKRGACFAYVAMVALLLKHKDCKAAWSVGSVT